MNVVKQTDLAKVTYDLFTAPGGPNSINNEDDAEESVQYCLPAIKKSADKYAGFVVACYSAHPLTGILRKEYPDKPSVGIFETSVTMALSVCGQSRTDQGPQGTWGIVTTGKVWETLLTNAVQVMLALPSDTKAERANSGRFAGVQSTGLNASELHDADPADVRKRLTKATEALLATSKNGVELKAVVLGCAGMAELEMVVREVVPKDVKVVDGVKAAFCTVASLILSKV